MSIYDLFPEKFYLLSTKNRKLFSLESQDRVLEDSVEEAFEKLPILEGSNIYAMYRYDSSVMVVMKELSDKFKTTHKEVQGLPAYFKNFEEGELFVRHNAEVTMIDLKRSILKIKAMEQGCDVIKTDFFFVHNWGVLYLKYETYSFGYLTDKIYMGEVNPKKRVCRFCQKMGNERFKEHSHAIQDGLGNKLLYCNEECDECNHEFEKSVEWHLYKFLEINRTLSNVTGKTSRNHHLEGYNFNIHPDPKTFRPIVFVKHDQIINDRCRGKITGKIQLYNKGKISHQGLYKALLKIAIDMMPNDKKDHFIETGKWVHGDFEATNLPPVLYGEHTDFFAQPVIDLFFKKETSPEFSPYCTTVLYIFDAVFLYIVPLNNIDGDRFNYPYSLMSHWDFFKKKQYLYVEEWEEFDSNDKELKSPMYKIPILGRNDKYDVMYRKSDDDVFKRK